MSYYCSTCAVHWAPLHCVGDGCPQCGGGTKRRKENVDKDADMLFRTIKQIEKEALEQEERRQAFREFYVNWEVEHDHEEWRAATPDVA